MIGTAASYFLKCGGETLFAYGGGDVTATEEGSADGVGGTETGDAEKVTVGLGDVVGEIIEEEIEIVLESGVGCISGCVCAVCSCVGWDCFSFFEQQRKGKECNKVQVVFWGSHL